MHVRLIDAVVRHARSAAVIGACALGATLAGSASAAVFTGAGGPLVDATNNGGNIQPGSAIFPITVSGTGGLVTSVNAVTLTNLTHTWIGDNVIALFAPDGVTYATVTSPPDDVSANFNGTYRFVVDPLRPTVDEASIPLSDTQDLASGTYAVSDYGGGGLNPGPRTTYASLTGQPMDGTWFLLIQDYGPGDTGALGSWSMDVTYTPEPAALGVLAIALPLCARPRRVRRH